MQSFLIRLLITIGIIWLAQKLLEAFHIQADASRIIFIVVIVVAIIWLVFGGNLLQ